MKPSTTLSLKEIYSYKGRSVHLHACRHDLHANSRTSMFGKESTRANSLAHNYLGARAWPSPKQEPGLCAARVFFCPHTCISHQTFFRQIRRCPLKLPGTRHGYECILLWYAASGGKMRVCSCLSALVMYLSGHQQPL